MVTVYFEINYFVLYLTLTVFLCILRMEFSDKIIMDMNSLDIVLLEYSY